MNFRIPLHVLVVAYLLVGFSTAGWYSLGVREHASRYPTGVQMIGTVILWPMISLINLGYELRGEQTILEPSEK